MKRIFFPLAVVALVLIALTGFARGMVAQGGGGAGAAAIKSLVGCGASNLVAQDDFPSATASLPFTLNFFGTSYSSLYVNNNGNVTFDSSLSAYTPFGLVGTTHVIIAPFFADVDTRDAGSALTTYGSTTYGGRPAFCVNWDGVGYYEAHSDKLNRFQLLLIDRSDVGTGDFDIMMNYNQIQWETGDASGGRGGLGGSSARAGYSNGSTVSLELPGSAVNGALLDSSASGLTHGNRGSVISGRYIFPVRNGEAPTGGTITGRVLGDPRGAPPGSAGIVGTPLAGAPVMLCPGTGPPCQTTTSNADGMYQFTGLPAGAYNAAGYPPPGWTLLPGLRPSIELGDGVTLTGQDIFLGYPTAPPDGVVIEHFATLPNGTPVIHWDRSVPFSIQNCPGGSSAIWQIILQGSTTPIQSGPLVEGPSGTYSGKIVPLVPAHGPAILRIHINCPSPTPDKDLDIDVYIDPSGVVRTVSGTPIPGATVTLYRSDSSSGPFDNVPNGSAVMSISNRNNPDTTDADGVFHWDVIAGFYKVRAQMTGCHAPGNADILFVETAVLSIPPPVTNLDLRLDCPGLATATPTRTPGAATATPTRTRTPTATPTPRKECGDVNDDGAVNALDALAMLQYIANLTHELPNLPSADVNGDGTLNALDVLLVLQHAAGLVPTLRC